MESTKTYNEIYHCWEWTNSQGLLHRENDLPAIEYDNGDKFWYLNGQPHRVNGPAVELTNGWKAWCLNGQRHRVDGPAVIYADSSVEYWEHGVRVLSAEDKERAEIARLENESTLI